MPCKGDSYLGGNGTLSFDQIIQLWTQNGGPAGWAPLMAGIAMAESSGHYGVLNDCADTGDYSVGLWQINYYGGLLTERSAKYGSPQALANDPNAQAKAAIDLFGGGAGLSNWQGDATWRAWQAHGSPQQPSAATVQSWGTAGAGTPGTLPPAGAGGGPTDAAGSQLGSSGNAGTVSGKPDGCMIGEPGIAGIGKACFLSRGQAKAVKGALLLAGGAILMGLGGFETVMVAMRGTQAGRSIAGSQSAKLARKVVTKTPIGKAASKMPGGRTGAMPKLAGGRRANTRAVKAGGYSERDVTDAFEAGRQTGTTQGHTKEDLARFRREGFEVQGSSAPTPGRVREMRRPRRGPIRAEEAA